MKKGVFGVLTLVAGSLLLFSCNRVSEIVTQEQKEDASAQIKLANEKFLAVLSEKFDSSEVDFDDESTWGPEAELMEAAWNSIYTGDDSEFITKAKELGVYSDFKKIVNEYDVKENSRVLRCLTNDSSRGISASRFYDGSLRSGDILLCAGIGEEATSISYVADTV
ncbi:MAG: hypothetical protein IIT73_07705, partial [Treponema sp.]|nr:hypothetical protein [Treponema sp.]